MDSIREKLMFKNNNIVVLENVNGMTVMLVYATNPIIVKEYSGSLIA